jgi:hypothetical protein
VTVQAFWRIAQAHRPVPAELRRLAAIPGLAEAWQIKLTQRADWLEHGQPDPP